MTCRATALPFLVCGWCAAQATQDSEELDRRLRLVELERSRAHLTAAESMLADIQADIERTEGPGVRLAVAIREHGLLLDDEDRSEEAISLYERALAMIRAQPRVSPAFLGLLIGNLAGSHADRGDFQEALALSNEAMTVLRNTGKDFETRPEFAVALYAHGVALHGLGSNLDALRCLRQALNICQHGARPDDLQVALVHEAMGSCFESLGYINQAEASTREALAIREKVFGPDSLGVAASLNNLGVLLTNRQRFSEAEQLLVRASQIFGNLGKNELHRLSVVFGNLGTLYERQARNGPDFYSKAEEAYRRKLATEERMFGVSDVRVAPTLELLGEILYHERSYNEAGLIYGRGLALQQAALGSSDPKTKAAAKRYNVLAKKMTVVARANSPVH
jgi:tetratricopeptide (TPR) repeat protein